MPARSSSARLTAFSAASSSAPPDGRNTAQVLDVIPGQPLLVKVDDAQPFKDGDDFLYCDVQPGDEWVIANREDRNDDEKKLPDGNQVESSGTTL